MSLDTNTILSQIKSALYWDNRVNSDNINVEIKEDTVVLKGIVDSYTSKRAAYDDVMELETVSKAINEIEVKPKTDMRLSDKELENRVSNKYSWDSDLASDKIDVEVKNSVVNISGSVDSLWKKDWAERIAETTYGILLVRNSIVVAPLEDINDEVIAKRISEALSAKLLRNVLDKFNTVVQEGVVTFTGRIPDYYSWNLILDVARYTTGVIDIEDKLTILPQE